MPKSWVYEPITSHYDALLFYNAMKRHYDPFYYIPISVAKREEIGTKYRFLCIARDRSNPEQASLFAKIELYKPPVGIPYATSLYRISPEVWS
ncbi:MAG: hypothetical protein K0R46_806 [Herbinix sp.]|jgi:hypothetical protein|nr:hypothetical protein [Herbinix sp.]